MTQEDIIPLRIAIQMDPIETINIDTDTSFVIALEAQRRNHELYYYTPNNLHFLEGEIHAFGHSITLQRQKGAHAQLGKKQKLSLKNFDVILIRQDPPFDMAYITNTHLLELLPPSVLILNHPKTVRNAPEKLFLLQFPDLIPPTLITADTGEIVAFRQKHQDIVIKPLYGNGGYGVFHVKADDENLHALLEVHQRTSREPLVIQRYIPEVRQGDKRVILIDGQAVGAVNRIPKSGEARSNLHVGGRAAKTELSARDLHICQAIGPTLKKLGILFAGIDIIGPYLTEINITSPTGFQQINQLNNTCLERIFWDALEKQKKA